MANALAGIAAGTVRVDGALGGLGGCPFAPGASGNLPLEDLVRTSSTQWASRPVSTLQKLLDASFLACEIGGRTPTSHLSQAGPRFASQAVPREE